MITSDLVSLNLTKIQDQHFRLGIRNTWLSTLIINHLRPIRVNDFDELSGEAVFFGEPYNQMTLRKWKRTNTDLASQDISFLGKRPRSQRSNYQ